MLKHNCYFYFNRNLINLNNLSGLRRVYPSQLTFLTSDKMTSVIMSGVTSCVIITAALPGEVRLGAGAGTHALVMLITQQLCIFTLQQETLEFGQQTASQRLSAV